MNLKYWCPRCEEAIMGHDKRRGVLFCRECGHELRTRENNTNKDPFCPALSEEAQKEGRFVMEGWEAMNPDLMEELADGEEL